MAKLSSIVKSCLTVNRIQRVEVPHDVHKLLPSPIDTELEINKMLNEDERILILWRLANKASLGIKNIEMLSHEWQDTINNVQVSLQNELNISEVNIYTLLLIAPESGWTRPPHSDAEMLIIVQLFGKKYWNIYNQIGEPGISYGLKDLNSARSFGDYLCAGNLLTVPKRFIHHANCYDKTMCIALTIGVGLSKLSTRESKKVHISLEEPLSPTNKLPQQYKELVSKGFSLIPCQSEEHSLIYQKLKHIAMHFQIDQQGEYTQSSLQNSPKDWEHSISIIYINELPIGYFNRSTRLVYIRPLLASKWLFEMVENEIKLPCYD